MNQDILEKIKSEIEIDFEKGGYKLRNAHFENGRNLHSNQYYFAKKYFQNTKNCAAIASLLFSKLEDLKFPESTTLIGLQNYTGLFLNKTIELTRKYNYAIVEQIEETFIWQHLPKKLKDNLVIVLPITCTCSTYIKLRKFLIDYLKRNEKFNHIKVNDNFINVFLILDESLKPFEEKTIEIKQLKDSNNEINEINEKLFNIYSAFNWTEINQNTILFNNKNAATYVANPLIRLYSEMYLPESCPLCFLDEKPIFSIHDNYETPNLIFGFNNFKLIDKQENFLRTFASNEDQDNILLSGHINVDETSYPSFIRGNAFYEKNKKSILEFFNYELSEQLKSVEKIIFITAENKHNSNFLEDISLQDSLKGKSVTILRFQPWNEFVDNFISIHNNEITDMSAKVIYFEEVLAAGKTFKLVSNYIKHARKNEPKITGRHGFDLVLTLVDRTPLFTKNEIIKKIFSKQNEYPEKQFLSFFSLNVPIFSAAHLGNPLKRKIENLEKMVEQCHLDSLKKLLLMRLIKDNPKIYLS